MQSSNPHLFIHKIDIETHKVVDNIYATDWCFLPKDHRNIFGNDKRLVWLKQFLWGKHLNNNFSDRLHTIGISYIDFGDEFTNENVKTDTNWMLIKSDLDKYYETLPKTDSMISRYIKSLGFKDNNIIVMLRDKWVDAMELKSSYKGSSVDSAFIIFADFRWYETAIYIYDFNDLNPSWDTLNLSEGFSLLKEPHRWMVENRKIYAPNILDWLDTTIRSDGSVIITNSNKEMSSFNITINLFGIYKWSDNELAVALLPKEPMQITPGFENANRILLIYNFDTKQWRKFEFPGDIDLPNFSNKHIIDWNGNKYFHITPANRNDTSYINKFLKYTPKTSIEETESIFKMIGMQFFKLLERTKWF